MSGTGSSRKRKEREGEVVAIDDVAASAAALREGATVTPPKDKNEGNKERILKIVHQELNQQGDAYRISRLLDKLANFCYGDGPAVVPERKILDRAGGHAVILSVLKRHEKYARVQSTGMRALQNLSCGIGNDIEARMVEAYAVETVSQAMKRFPEDESVQRCGCGLFANLSWVCSSAKKRIIAEGGVSVIVSAMKNHPDSKKLQFWGCKVLDNMKGSPEGKAAVLDAGGCSAIFAAVENHRNDEEIVKAAKEAFEGLDDIFTGRLQPNSSRFVSFENLDVYTISVANMSIVCS
jgi:hypothetical protein